MTVDHHISQAKLAEETAHQHLEAQEKMSFCIDKVSTIQMETAYMAAHFESATQTGIVISGINKLGEMLSALTGGKVPWKTMEIPNPDEIPKNSKDLLTAAK